MLYMHIIISVSLHAKFRQCCLMNIFPRLKNIIGIIKMHLLKVRQNVTIIQSFNQKLFIISMIIYYINICLPWPTTIASQTILLTLVTAEVKNKYSYIAPLYACLLIDHCTYLYMYTCYGVHWSTQVIDIISVDFCITYKSVLVIATKCKSENTETKNMEITRCVPYMLKLSLIVRRVLSIFSITRYIELSHELICNIANAIHLINHVLISLTALMNIRLLTLYNNCYECLTTQLLHFRSSHILIYFVCYIFFVADYLCGGNSLRYYILAFGQLTYYPIR